MIRILAFVEAGNVSGPAKNLLALSRQFRSAALPIEIQIATFYREAPDNDFTRAVESEGLVLHRIAERSAYDSRVLSRLHEIVSSSAPSILQTHAIKSHFLMRLSGEGKRLPWIAFHHGYTLTSPRMRLYNQLDRWSLRAPRRIVVVSQSFARDLVSKGIAENRITVMHNAIDPKWGGLAQDPALRARTRAAVGLQENEKALLIVGRLSLEKSHVALVEAVARLRQLLPQTPVRLIIVGEGPERGAIEQAAQSFGISDKVHFAGYTRDVLPYYAAADLAVLASLSEGSPNALLEAMVARVPVVATSVGGIPEIVRDRQSALLVPPADVAALTAALAQALGDPALSNALAARAHEEILAHYTPEQRAASLYHLYASIAPDQGGAR